MDIWGSHGNAPLASPGVGSGTSRELLCSGSNISRSFLHGLVLELSSTVCLDCAGPWIPSPELLGKQNNTKLLVCHFPGKCSGSQESLINSSPQDTTLSYAEAVFLLRLPVLLSPQFVFFRNGNSFMQKKRMNPRSPTLPSHASVFPWTLGYDPGTTIQCESPSFLFLHTKATNRRGLK